MVGISKNGVNPPVSCSGRRGVVGQTRTPAGSASVASGGASRDGARSPGGSRSDARRLCLNSSCLFSDVQA